MRVRSRLGNRGVLGVLGGLLLLGLFAAAQLVGGGGGSSRASSVPGLAGQTSSVVIGPDDGADDDQMLAVDAEVGPATMVVRSESAEAQDSEEPESADADADALATTIVEAAVGSSTDGIETSTDAPVEPRSSGAEGTPQEPTEQQDLTPEPDVTPSPEDPSPEEPAAPLAAPNALPEPTAASDTAPDPDPEPDAEGVPEPTPEPSPPATPPTIQERGQEALSYLSYDFATRLPAWDIQFLPERVGYRGLTFSQEFRIEIYVRPTDDAWTIARIVAHELGHAVDISRNDSADRNAWMDARGLGAAVPWWPGSGVADFGSGAGDFAECFATWQVGSGSLSNVAGACTADQLNLMASLA